MEQGQCNGANHLCCVSYIDSSSASGLSVLGLTFKAKHGTRIAENHFLFVLPPHTYRWGVPAFGAPVLRSMAGLVSGRLRSFEYLPSASQTHTGMVCPHVIHPSCWKPPLWEMVRSTVPDHKAFKSVVVQIFLNPKTSI